MHKNFYKREEEHPVKKRSKLLLVFSSLFVVFLLSVLLFYYQELPFTGNAIQNFNESNYIFISTELDAPSLIYAKGDYDYLKIEASQMFLTASGKDFDLTSSKNNFIELTNYSGKLNFTDKNVQLLDGKSARVVINGVPVSSNKKMSINSVSSFAYSYLRVGEDFYIKELDYRTSGVLRFGNNFDSITLTSDEILIKDFVGSLEIKNNKMFLIGYAQSINVNGEQKISISR